MRAWHFVDKTLRDGSPIPKNGVKLVHPGAVIPCNSGLHASLHPFDALKYAPGTTLCLVECGGLIRQQSDKLACSERTIIARMNARSLLRHFARSQALSVAHLWDPPNVVLDYLMGDDRARKPADAAMRQAVSHPHPRFAQEAKRSANWATNLPETHAAEFASESAMRAWLYAATGHFSVQLELSRASEGAVRDEFEALVNEAFEDWL